MINNLSVGSLLGNTCEIFSYSDKNSRISNRKFVLLAHFALLGMLRDDELIDSVLANLSPLGFKQKDKNLIHGSLMGLNFVKILFCLEPAIWKALLSC